MAAKNSPLLTDTEALELELQASAVFTPSSPVNNRDLFAGRLEQVRRVLDAVNQTGLHAILYGQRGVGKTSLVNVLRSFLEGFSIPHHQPVAVLKATCTTESTYDSVWRDALGEARVIGVARRAGIRKDDQMRAVPIELGPEQLTPVLVRRLLAELGTKSTLIVVVDEFDRIESNETRQQFADTVKILSDHQVPATILLVGVAESVGQLLSQHESVGRALMQVEMPPIVAVHVNPDLENSGFKGDKMATPEL